MDCIKMSRGSTIYGYAIDYKHLLYRNKLKSAKEQDERIENYYQLFDNFEFSKEHLAFQSVNHGIHFVPDCWKKYCESLQNKSERKSMEQIGCYVYCPIAHDIYCCDNDCSLIFGFHFRSIPFFDKLVACQNIPNVPDNIARFVYLFSQTDYFEKFYDDGWWRFTQSTNKNLGEIDMKALQSNEAREKIEVIRKKIGDPMIF